MRRPFTPPHNLSVSYTIWREDKRQTYTGEGKKIPSLKCEIFSQIFLNEI